MIITFPPGFSGPGILSAIIGKLLKYKIDGENVKGDEKAIGQDFEDPESYVRNGILARGDPAPP